VSQFIAEIVRDDHLDPEDEAILRSYYDPNLIVNQETLNRVGGNLDKLSATLGSAKKAIAAAKKAQIEKVPAGQVYETAAGSGAMTDKQYVVASNAGTVPFDAIKLQAAMRRMGTAD
jgi:hypothetical protein